MNDNNITITHTDELGKKTTMKLPYQGPTNAWAIRDVMAIASQRLYTEIIRKRDQEKQKNVKE